MGMLTNSLLELVLSEGVTGQRFMENREICEFLLPMYCWMKDAL